MSDEIVVKEKAVLGDETVFIKRTPKGTIKCVRGNVLLTEEEKQLAKIEGNNYIITAPGYYKMNKIAGLSIITPPTLTLPTGQEVSNPYPIFDPESKTISKVWVKKGVIGYSPTGNLVITTTTLLYDINLYFIQDMVKKIQQNKKAGRLCTKSMLSEKDKSTGIFLNIQGDMGVWANLDEPDTYKAFKTFIQNKLFADRKAQTIAERNCLKKHPALASSTVMVKIEKGTAHACIPVIGFCHDFDKDDLDKLSIEALNENASENPKFEVINDNSINPSDEDLCASNEIDEDVVDESVKKQDHNFSIPAKKQEEQFVAVDDSSEKQELLQSINAGKKIIGEDAFAQIIKRYGNKSINELNIPQLKTLKSAIETKANEAPFDAYF